MALTRYINLTDLCVIIVVAVVFVMPERSMTARKATNKLSADGDHALALAEARVLAHPDDGLLVADYARLLTEANHKDWAVEAAARASARTESSPSHWRALLATSVAYIDRVEPTQALAWGQRALQACTKIGEASCPSWEQVRMEMYNQHLDAGVKSGIDAKKNPLGFRAAGESGLRTIHLKQAPTAPAPVPVPVPAPVPVPDSGSGSGSAAPSTP